MNVSIVVATYGEQRYADLAWERAIPSTAGQGAVDVRAVHLPDGTLAQARNRGAREAGGDALVFLDADDELEPGYLDAMRPLLEPRALIVLQDDHLFDHRAALEGRAALGGFVRVVSSGEAEAISTTAPTLGVPAVRYVWPGGRESAAGIPQQGRWPELNECVIGTLVSRDLFFRVGGFRDLPSLEDYDLWLRCFDAGARLAYVPHAVYRAHVNPAGRNRDQSCYARIWSEHLARISPS